MAEKDIARTRRRPNYFYSISSVALVLFLLGFFGLLLLNAQQLVRLFKERINILVELQDGLPPGQRDSLQTTLSTLPYVKEGSIQFIDKTSAAQLMEKDFGEDFLKLDLPNPFYDLLLFNVNSSYMQSDSLEAIRTEIRALSGVGDVFYQESLIDEVAANLRQFGFIALGLGAFFIILAVTLIHNTIRLALYSNRFLIKNMQLVGASWGFISRPYIWRAIGHGFISGVLAIAGLVGVMAWISAEIPELDILGNAQPFLILFGSLLLAGIVIYALSSFNVVNRYLRMRVDDLY